MCVCICNGDSKFMCISEMVTGGVCVYFCNGDSKCVMTVSVCVYLYC